MGRFLRGRKDQSVEKVYETFFKKKGHYPEMQYFQHFFENLMIRSYSEAMAETVGSIMGIGISRGRNTHPNNLEKEVKLRFNLPPFHILTEKFIPELVEESETEYFRRGDGKKEQMRKFKFSKTSASIGNLRLNEISKSHLPLDFFI